MYKIHKKNILKTCEVQKEELNRKSTCSWIIGFNTQKSQFSTNLVTNTIKIRIAFFKNWTR